MFTKPIDEIIFEDIQSFCEEWPEGVRVEYKSDVREITGKIPKIVSSFANTYGGVFLIGVEADQKNNQVHSIPGIPQRNGIEEQIQQSALTGIYPGVTPEIKVVNVPNSNNMIIVVRVDESIQAPHAIEGSTKIYFRSGSTTQPYNLADIDRITYMLKRREDSQIIAQQIFDRIEKRASRNFPIHSPTLTVIAKPVFPYRPVISALDVYNLCKATGLFPLRRVEGGVSTVHPKEYLEFNEYGVAYHKIALSISDQQEINYSDFLFHLYRLIERSVTLYKRCEYLGNIEISARLQEVLDKGLGDPGSHMHGGSKITDATLEDIKCSDSEVFVSGQYLARDLENPGKRADIIEELTNQLLWAFNIAIDEPWVRERIRRRIEYGPL